MGQKMVCFGELRGTRSRQDESKEVHEVGSKRPSLGCNGVHFVWWIGLICALLWGESCHYKLRASPAKATMELPFARNYPVSTSELPLSPRRLAAVS